MDTTATSSYPPPQAALTTIFTPPSFCTPYVDASSWISSLTESRLSSCFPGKPSIEGLIHSVYYSPGICPSGYTIDCMRFDDFQGPSVLSGETAAICCPSSFSCAPNDALQCVSTAKAESTVYEAVYVQVRWKESDLALFETPPLTSGTLTTRRHSGWDPDGALYSVYTFPSDCSSSTDTWLIGSETTCQPLTGDYYSPAICPDGWTAAYTRQVLGGNGPPVEADETAIGLNSAMGYGCGEGACISTSLVSLGTGFSIDLLMSRPAIQIRWASSDLSSLATHPLTPGLTLNSNVPSTNHPVLPALATGYQLGLGLAFLPLLLALAVAVGASLIFRSRQQAEISVLPGNHFRPWILKRRVVIILIGLMASALILVEISCHVLPRSVDVLNEATLSTRSLSTRSVTKVYISEVIVKRAESNSTADYKMTCGVEGPHSVSYVTTQDHGSTVRESVIVGASGTVPTTVCRIDDEKVQLPTCYEPPTAPPPEDFLDDTDSAVKGGYFVATVLGPFAAAAFGIPWKILAIHAASLEPLRQLARPYGTRMSSFLVQYDGMGAISAPLPVICRIMTYTTAIIAPLAAEGWKIKLQGNCDESSSQGCTPVVVVSPVVARILEVVLAMNIILAVGMVVVLSHWSTGLRADPRSILGVASLSHSPNLLASFSSWPKKVKWWQWWGKTEQRHFSQTTLHYGYHMDNATGRQDFGILVAGDENICTSDIHPNAEKSTQSTTQQQLHPHQTHPFPLKTVLLLSVFALGLVVLATVIIYYRFTPDTQALGRFLSSQSFGPRFVFSIVGVLINFLWVAIFTKYLLYAPYLELSLGPAVSSKSIALPYASDSYTYLFTGIKSVRFLAVGICLSTIFSDFLPLTLANIPFNRTNTWNAYVASTWVSVALIVFLIITLIAIITTILVQPQSRFISTKRVKKSPIQYILYTLNKSSGLMQSLDSLSELNTSDRDQRVKESNLRYKLIETNEGQNEFRPRIEVSTT